MNRFWVFLTIVFFFSSSTYAQFELPSASGARAIALGRAYTGVGGDFWALFHNPAGIAGISSPEAAVFVEQRFLLNQLTAAQAGFVTPFYDKQALGVSLGSFGFDAYRESSIGLTYAIEVLGKIRVGAEAKYANLTIQEFGSAGNLLVQVGVQTQINRQLSLGFSGYNVNRAQLQTSGPSQVIPAGIRAGLCYHPESNIYLVVDVLKDIDHPLSYRGGVEYIISDLIKARMGIATEPLSINGGIGLAWREFSFDFASSYTERLGYSPHMSLNYTFNRNQD